VSTYSVLLVEDDASTRAYLRNAVLVHPELQLIGAVGSVGEARAQLAERSIDVLLTDLGLPDGSGIELIAEASAVGGTLSLVVTVFGDEVHVVEAIEAGAMGYLLKDQSPDDVGRAILDMIHGGSPMSPAIARYLLRRLHDEKTEPVSHAPRLSEREREVLGLIVKGFTYAEIAELTGISTHTVSSHIRKLYRKLSVHSRGEAVYEALQLGIVRSED
jgi:DNA-binding NarL/FixJ family response regulator